MGALTCLLSFNDLCVSGRDNYNLTAAAEILGSSSAFVLPLTNGLVGIYYVYTHPPREG